MKEPAETICLAVILLMCVFTASFHSTSASPAPSYYCQINVRRSDNLPNIPPLLLHSDKPEIIYPDTSQNVYIDSKKNIRLVCAGKENVLSLSKGSTRRLQEISPECVYRDSFKAPQIRPGEISFTEFGCDQELTPTAVLNGSCLNGKYTQIRLGFQISPKEFVTTVQLCFDKTNYDALYSKVTLTPGIEYRQYWTTRPDTFTASTLYNTIGIDQLYSRFKQRETLTTILGDRQLAERYIPRTPADTKLYLTRGHLAPMADFIYGAEQRSTFFYVNAAPQWRSFNDGNWETLEISVRGFAASRNSKLEVYTGTWGNSVLEDKNGRLQPLHLHIDRNKNRAVRVPAYFWKVLYDPETKEGAAFVGINNPFLRNASRQVFCTDICDNFKWLQWSPRDVSMGYSFCCSVDDFSKTVTTIPNFEVTSTFKPESKNCKSVELCNKPSLKPTRSRKAGA